MDLRKHMYQNIVISGGSTLFKGFGDRLLSEVKKLLDQKMFYYNKNVKVD